MAKQSKIEIAVAAVEAAGIKVLGYELRTNLTDAMVGVGHGIVVQMTRNGAMYIVVTHPDGRMSFEQQGTPDVQAVIRKLHEALEQAK